MGKRKITHQQANRARQQQDRHISRAEKKHPNDVVCDTPTEPGTLIAHYGTTVFIENRQGILFRCRLRQNLGNLTTGDEIIFQPAANNEGVVVACLPRRNVLYRATRQGKKPFAANVDKLLVVLAVEPAPSRTTLDRYCVLAAEANLEIMVVLNKADLGDLTENPARYTGLPLINISVKTEHNLAQLKTLLAQHCTLIVGQSGVGKSSLLCALVPDANARIQALSTLQRTGKHTTTASRLFHLPGGGALIDTPGTNQIAIHHLTPSELLLGYPEFEPFLSQCQFRDCAHTDATRCGLHRAIAAGEIASERLENYQKLCHEHLEAIASQKKFS